MRTRTWLNWWRCSSLFLLLAAGCGWVSPPPTTPGPWTRAEDQRAITDPKLQAAAQDWQTWVLQQRRTPQGQLLFSRTKVLPVTMMTLPYGVGDYQQQPRLPVILTTGPGWSVLKPAQKEEQAARVYRELSDRLARAVLGPEPRPTLTLQTPQGMLLAWINDLSDARRRIHGDND